MKYDDLNRFGLQSGALPHLHYPLVHHLPLPQSGNKLSTGVMVSYLWAKNIVSKTIHKPLSPINMYSNIRDNRDNQ